jgi:hypothetical protein
VQPFFIGEYGKATGINGPDNPMGAAIHTEVEYAPEI